MARFENEAFAVDHAGVSVRVGGLSGWQLAASRLTGGGHDAFSRYERGQAAPRPAVVNLFRPLDKHPELLEDLR